MSLLEKLEQLVLERWRKAMAAKTQEEKQKLMALYREAYEAFLRQRNWIKAMESI